MHNQEIKLFRTVQAMPTIKKCKSWEAYEWCDWKGPSTTVTLNAEMASSFVSSPMAVRTKTCDVHKKQSTRYSWRNITNREVQRRSSVTIIENMHIFGCLVCALDSNLEFNKSMPKWNPRARMGLNIGTSPKHARNINVILNLQTRIASPQFHLQHNDFCETAKEEEVASVTNS